MGGSHLSIREELSSPEFCVGVTGVGKTDPCALLVRFWCTSNLDLASTRRVQYLLMLILDPELHMNVLRRSLTSLPRPHSLSLRSLLLSCRTLTLRNRSC
jgi:hypothetical protein